LVSHRRFHETRVGSARFVNDAEMFTKTLSSDVCLIDL